GKRGLEAELPGTTCAQRTGGIRFVVDAGDVLPSGPRSGAAFERAAPGNLLAPAPSTAREPAQATMASSMPSGSRGCSAAAASAVWQWPEWAIECKATFLHVVTEVEARWRRERLPRSRSAPVVLRGGGLGPAQAQAQRSRTQRRRQQRVAGKKRRRGEAVAAAAGRPP
ncbi:unnamed protein product, partial [Prorocentrum cordatum]